MLSRFPNIFSFIQIRQISSITALLILVGCASISERNPIAPDNLTKATITGIPDARFWGDEWPKFGKKIIDTFTDEQFRKNFPASYGKTHAYIEFLEVDLMEPLVQACLPVGLHREQDRSLIWSLVSVLVH